MRRFTRPKFRKIGVFAVVFSITVCAGCTGNHTVAAPVTENQFLLHSDFSAIPDGPLPANFDSGQQATLAPVADPSWRLFVQSGRLTFAPTTEGPAAGYVRTPDLGRPISRMGMEWVTEPGPGGGPGVAAMGVGGEQVDPTDSNGAPLSMHFLARRDIWNFSVSPGPFNGDPRLITIAAGGFDPPLAEDGTTLHRVDIAVNGPDVELTLPDGTVTRFSDQRIAAWAGRFGFFEVFSESGPSDGRVGLVRVWADT